MNIALISNYVPGKRPVSEYCYHLVRALKNNRKVQRIHVIADMVDGYPEIHHEGKLTIHRVWRFDSPLLSWQIVNHLRELSVDCCWFNITLGSFGMTTANFMGMMVPLITKKLLNIPCLITLHNMIELVDLKKMNSFNNRFIKWGATLATWMLTRAGNMCVLLPEYEIILKQKYKAQHVKIMPHGSLGGSGCVMDQSKKMISRKRKNLLAFGIFGTHKKLETTLAAMRHVYEIDQDVRLNVVGASNAHNPDYLEELRRRYSGNPNIRFIGYVPEEKVHQIHSENEAAIMPYHTIGGESGALIQSCMYQMPLLVSDLPFFRKKEQEGYCMDFFDIQNTNSIAKSILQLFENSPGKLRHFGEKNYYAARTYSMDDVIAQYIELIQEKIIKKESSMASARLN
ncbi:glycosyltransferase [bacterium]|nr:glycosyltransferase [bacterium]